MSRLQEKFQLSLKELRKTKTIVGCGLLAAVHILLDMYATFYIIPGTLKVSLSFVAYGICGFLYGPITAGIYGIILDLLSFLIKPDGVFFIGYTFSAFMTGFLFGCALYKERVTLPRTLFSKLIVSLIINIFLTPLWLYIMGWGALSSILSGSRLIKNIVLLPLEGGLLYTLLRSMKRIAK